VTYAETVQSWHDFYLTAGAAAATLVGLLFVGLSLHISVVNMRPKSRSCPGNIEIQRTDVPPQLRWQC
jgi:hypothetical protein